jgi:hypothetical protein
MARYHIECFCPSALYNYLPLFVIVSRELVLIHYFLHLQPVLDIKPYLPYSDSVKGAAIPNWLEVQTMWHAILCITLSL